MQQIQIQGYDFTIWAIIGLNLIKNLISILYVNEITIKKKGNGKLLIFFYFDIANWLKRKLALLYRLVKKFKSYIF